MFCFHAIGNAKFLLKDSQLQCNLSSEIWVKVKVLLCTKIKSQSLKIKFFYTEWKSDRWDRCKEINQQK